MPTPHRGAVWRLGERDMEIEMQIVIDTHTSV